ncbi:MAG: CPBP family intramembrane glutamic endopeptidase [Caldilineaceae bacterium]
MATDINSLPPTTNNRFPFFQQHPVGTAVLIFLLYLLISTLCGFGAQRFFPDYQPEFIALIALAILLAVTLTGLGWWRATGFNGPAAWQRLPLAWIPIVIVLGLPFLRGLKPSDGNTLLYLLIGYALTGFREEGLMRGIVMRVLQPTGAVRSVVISALLFGLMHIGNLLYRNPAIVVAQMVGAFVHGIGLGAIRLRTNTIWLVVALHGLHDLALKYTNFPAIPLDVVQVTLLMLYGIYLLRTRPARDEGSR